MKAVYDKHTDTLTLQLQAGKVSESDESHSGVILDYDAAGKLVGIEILDASKQVFQPEAIEFRVSE